MIAADSCVLARDDSSSQNNEYVTSSRIPDPGAQQKLCSLVCFPCHDYLLPG